MIDTEKDTKKILEKAVLVGVQPWDMGAAEAEGHLAELRELVRSLGISVAAETHAKYREPSARYLLGGGKASEIAELMTEKGAGCAVFDCELSPSQQRNWEALLKIPVLDRQEVIIDIFAARASTREAVLQVDLAKLKYSLPRLKRAWSHLSRQRGGALGTRGEGEQQIEYDKRLVKDRIRRLEAELSEVRARRGAQRKGREKSGVPTAAIVGYTNAGKSSLLNRLSGAGAFVENKLFATLDPLTRRLELPDKRTVLLTDTVGFIRKLPHQLVEAFKSTLEEAVLADFLIVVIDAADPDAEEHWRTTLSVLEELGAHDKRMIIALNKSDLLLDPARRAGIKNLFPRGTLISASSGDGVESLLDEISGAVSERTALFNLRIPASRHDMISLAHRSGTIIKSAYDDDGSAIITAELEKSAAARFAEYFVKN
jgi:GTP-binding protein HflX